MVNIPEKWSPYQIYGQNTRIMGNIPEIWPTYQKYGQNKNFQLVPGKNQYFTLKYGPQHAFWTFGAIWARFGRTFFGNMHFSAYPISAQNGVFLGPEDPNLAENIKSIVVLTQNMTSQSQNWSHVETDNFGFSRPPKTPPGPPRAPQESKNGPNHQ